MGKKSVDNTNEYPYNTPNITGTNINLAKSDMEERSYKIGQLNDDMNYKEAYEGGDKDFEVHLKSMQDEAIFDLGANDTDSIKILLDFVEPLLNDDKEVNRAFRHLSHRVISAESKES